MKTLSKNDIPKLVGNRFVKEFSDYLLQSIRENFLNESQLVTKAFLEKNVKPTTTLRYINDLTEMRLIIIENGFLKVIEK